MLKIFSLLSFALLTLSEEITITGVYITISPTPTITHPLPIPVPSVSLSYLGPGRDGTVTLAVLYSFASTTSPFTHPGYTLQATFLAGSTQLVHSEIGYRVEIGESYTSTIATDTLVQACSWGEERIQGTCVHEMNGTPKATFYGTVGPMITLAVDSGARSVNARPGWSFYLLVVLGATLGIFRLFV